MGKTCNDNNAVKVSDDNHDHNAVKVSDDNHNNSNMNSEIARWQ